MGVDPSLGDMQSWSWGSSSFLLRVQLTTAVSLPHSWSPIRQEVSWRQYSQTSLSSLGAFSTGSEERVGWAWALGASLDPQGLQGMGPRSPHSLLMIQGFEVRCRVPETFALWGLRENTWRSGLWGSNCTEIWGNCSFVYRLAR